MAKLQRVTFFKTNLEDRPGSLLADVRALKSKNLGLVGLWGQGTQPGQAELYLVAKNPEKLRNAWKSSGMTFEEGTGFFEKGGDKTSALVKSLEQIARAGVNITAIGAIALSGKYGSFIRVAPADVEKKAAALGAK